MKKFLLYLHENFWNEYFNHKFWILFFIILGITFYFNLSNEPKLSFIFIILLISLFFILIAKYLKIKKHNAFLEYIFYFNICFLFFTFGIFIAKIDTEKHKKNLISKEILIENIRAKVEKIQFYKKQNKFCFKIKNFFSPEIPWYNKSKTQNNFLKICSFDNNSKIIKIGDDVIFYQVKLKSFTLPLSPNDSQFTRNSYFEDLIGVGAAKFVIKNLNFNNRKTLFEKINQWRLDFSKHLSEKFGNDVGGIMSAITIGDRSYISDEISDNMKRSSIFHLIAISGLHVSFVSLFFTFILTRLFASFFDKSYNYFKIKKIIYFLSLLFVTFYLVISGISLSAQRAFLMFLILNIYVYFGIQISTRNIIFWVVFIILIIQPHSILNPGLQMSLLAVTSLVFFDFNYYSSTWSNFKILRKSNYSNLIENVPHGTFSYPVNKEIKNETKCSTWNIFSKKNQYLMKNKLFHMEQFKKYIKKKSNLRKIHNKEKMFHMEHFLAKLIKKLKMKQNVPRGTFFIKIILSVLIPHIAIMPITLFYFQNTSTYSIVANIIAIPLATFIIMPLIILNFFLEMFHVEQINSLLEYCLKVSIKFLLEIGNFFANLPGGYIEIYQISIMSFSIMILGLIWFFIWHKNWRFFGLFLYLIGLISLFYNNNNFPNFFIYKNKDQIRFIFNDEMKLYGYFTAKEDFISKKILNSNDKKIEKIKNVPRGTIEFEIKNKKVLLCKNICDMNLINSEEKIDLLVILDEEENVPRGTFSYLINKKVKSETECSTWNILYISSKKIDENGAHSIFIKNDRFIVKTGLDYIGNRPWNFNYNND